MNKLACFAAKHKLLFTLLWTVPFAFLYGVILLLDPSSGAAGWLALPLTGFLYGLLMASTARSKLLLDPAKKLNEQCDPEPLLAEVVEQLGYVKSKSGRFELQLNQAVALLDMGHYEEVWRLLSSMSPDGVTLIPDSRVSYYSLMTELCCRQNNLEAAKVYLCKAKENLALVKNQKRRDPLVVSVADKEATVALYEGRTADARRFLADLPITYLCQRVGIAMTCGEIALREGNFEEAKQHFRFVMENGGKFYVVTEARAQLQRIAELQTGG